MREFIQAMMKEVLQRKIVGIRQLFTAAMTVLANQRSGAFRAVLRFFLMRRGHSCHWKRRFHWFGYPVLRFVQAALYSECGGIFWFDKKKGGGPTDLPRVSVGRLAADERPATWVANVGHVPLH